MKSVLIVEDNVLLATSIERFLRDFSMLKVTAIAPSAEIALEKLDQIPIDLVLIDIALPEMSGIDLVATIRKRNTNLPCLILSAHTENSYVRRALDAGANGYVVKHEPLSILIAIQQVLVGETYVSNELRRTLHH